MIGHSQVDTMSRSGQNRSNFKVGILDKKMVPIWLRFYSEFIGGIFSPVGGVQPLPPPKKKRSTMVYAV